VTDDWPRAGGEPPAAALLRVRPEDFRVEEWLGFEPSGEGEHVFLHLEKCRLTTPELARRVARVSGVPERDIGYAGMKDRNAVTRQWFSVRLPARPEPAWSRLESGGEVRVLAVRRHRRKLKRGVHRNNRFSLRLRELTGDPAALRQRLERVRREGAPNYFGRQRFGRDGATLEQARGWVAAGGPRVSRNRRSLYLSALRADLFNHLLAARVRDGTWNALLPGDVCLLQGSRSLFECGQVDPTLRRRLAEGDIHPGLPLWGRGPAGAALQRAGSELSGVAGAAVTCAFLEEAGLTLAWRATRMLADDFCWQFCDDDSLQLDFALDAGCYATALLAEFVRFDDARGQ
jgi:tRNA pseudouridine13 synthase